MRIAVVGCGAMGSLYAALLARARHEVIGVTRRAEHAAAINRDGLRLSGEGGEHLARLEARATSEGVGACDLVVVAVKAHDLAGVAAALPPLLGPQTVVQTIQAGLAPVEPVAAAVGADRLAVGVAEGFAACLPQPGHVRVHGLGLMYFAAFAGLGQRALQLAANPWIATGLQVALWPDAARMRWQALLADVSFAGPCALTGLSIGETLASADAWPVAEACVREAAAVAGAAGVRLDVGDPVAHVRRLAERIAAARPPALLDLLAGRRTEIEWLNGAVARLGRELGVPAPVNETVAGLARARRG